LVALLTLLAAAVATLSVTHRRYAERYLESVQLESVADSAIRVMLLRLIAPAQPGMPFRADGQVQSLAILGANVQLTVEREAGRIDLNLADPELLFAVFAANGWAEPDARAMAARIIDWRDPDDTPGPGGAESPQYVAAHLPYGPRNAPFESVAELRQVLGSERINDELFDAFTVYSHTPGVVESAAPAVVKRALAWADARQLAGHQWLSGGTASAGANGAVILVGEVIRLRACSQLQQSSARKCRLALVRLTGAAARPIQVFAWQDASSLSGQDSFKLP
jgi:general secretion pathway protein K